MNGQMEKYRYVLPMLTRFVRISVTLGDIHMF